MEIERTKDKVVLNAADLEKLVKTYIEKETGRKIDGRVNFNTTERSPHGYSTSAYAHLQFESEK